MYQKSEDLNYTATEAWILEIIFTPFEPSRYHL